MEKSRIAALVDGIFAVAMTLLVLDLKLPESVKISGDPEAWRQLLELTGRRRTAIPLFVVIPSIAISFYNPHLAMSAYWLLLVFHFLPGTHHRPPELDQ